MHHLYRIDDSENLPFTGKYIAMILVFLLCTGFLPAQTFTRITDQNNPIIATPGPTGYTGAAWIDFDNDDDVDLYVNHNFLYRNDGNGTFVSLSTDLGNGQSLVTGNGNTWADYDNDGDLDCFISSSMSFLYRNDGNGNFVKITEGDIGDGFANRGWASAWADINNDGNVDLVITHPAGFVPGGPATPNHLLMNDGPPDYTFTKIDTGVVVTGLDAYTVGTWSDYDFDGDMDLFIGSGPANGSTDVDNLYRNMLSETGTAEFDTIATPPIATDLQDGQVWNWIDYDNDGDLDAYLTNWGGASGGIANRLYRNDGNGYVEITDQTIATDSDISLSSVWGDFDNDGDLDCYVANDGGQPDRYYSNNGNGTFTRVDTAAIAASLTHRGASAGDYDNDGDLDLLAVGPGSSIALYQNDTQNANSWAKFKCEGTTSNRAGIGTKVRAKAVINGVAVWQFREVSAQNTFNGHNSLVVHFGLGDATAIDTLIFDWPSGESYTFTNVNANSFYHAVEGQDLNPITAINPADGKTVADFKLFENYPNPFNPETTVEYILPEASPVTLRVYNLLGQEVKTLVNATQAAGRHSTNWDGRNNAGQTVSSGIYVYKIKSGDFEQARKMVLLK